MPFFLPGCVIWRNCFSVEFVVMFQRFFSIYLYGSDYFPRKYSTKLWAKWACVSKRTFCVRSAEVSGLSDEVQCPKRPNAKLARWPFWVHGWPKPRLLWQFIVPISLVSGGMAFCPRNRVTKYMSVPVPVTASLARFATWDVSRIAFRACFDRRIMCKFVKCPSNAVQARVFRNSSGNFL